MAVSRAACVAAEAAGYTGAGSEAVGMAGSEAACVAAAEAVGMEVAEATGNRICGAKQFLSKKTRNGGKHDDADKRKRTKSSLVDCC